MSNHDITDVYDILTVGTETIPPKEIYYAKLGKLICAMHLVNPAPRGNKCYTSNESRATSNKNGANAPFFTSYPAFRRPFAGRVFLRVFPT